TVSAPRGVPRARGAAAEGPGGATRRGPGEAVAPAARRAPSRGAPAGRIDSRPDARGRQAIRNHGGRRMARETAVIVGAGPGLGWALVERFAQAGMHTLAAARHPEKLRQLIDGTGRGDAIQ